MKLDIKAVAFTTGIFGAIVLIWATVINLWGLGSVPYSLFDQLYFGLVPEGITGIFVGAVIGFIDGFIGGALLAWIYNTIASRT